MGLWSKLLNWRRLNLTHPLQPTLNVGEAASTSAEAAAASHEEPVTLPLEPFVFECESCGKVFEARRLRPLCPECDSRDVSLLSE